MVTRTSALARLLMSIFYLLMVCSLEAAPIVDASIESANSQAHFPLEGTITITHDEQESVDDQSFTMEGKPLKVSFIKHVPMSVSSRTFVTIYSFQLPAKDQGLYLLPAISVKIGNQWYQSVPSTYQVHDATPAPSSSEASSPTIFRLEAAVKGPSSLYPGERTTLFYRISYNRSIDLTRSFLPMVHPAHFQKIGDVHIKDYQDQNVTVQELTQEVEASELGTFSLGPSRIEGYAYHLEAGQKVYDSTLLTAEAPAVTIEVKPFPLSDQPPSFTGGLGHIKAEAVLTSSSTVFVGDEVKFQVRIQGITNLTLLRLPDLPCQPGFNGFFQTSDVPPPAEIKDDTKIFYLEMRPLTPLVTHVPSIQLSSWDPATQKYVVQQTDPLPLTVKAHASKEFPIPSNLPDFSLPTMGKWPVPDPVALELVQITPPSVTLPLPWWKTAWALWLLPMGLGLLLLQKRLYDWLQHPHTSLPRSEELFGHALRALPSRSSDVLSLLEQAIWHRLWEKEYLPSKSYQLNALSLEGKMGAVRSFLYQLQALQYSADHAFDPLQLKQQAREVFSLI